MAYQPASNEYPITNSVTAGWPSTAAAFLRVIVTNCIPGNNVTILAQLLDVNGNVLRGGNFTGSYDISQQTQLNSLLHSLFQSAAAAQNVTIS